MTKTKIYKSMQQLVQENDVIWITTPDDAISAIDHSISLLNVKGKSICHASGALPSTALQFSKAAGAAVFSIHPIYAFSHKAVTIEELQSVNFSLEGEFVQEEDDVVLRMMRKLGNHYFIRDVKTTAAYHLANVFVSNLTLALLDIGLSYFKEIGLKEEEAIFAAMPLIQGNIKNIEEKGLLSSLTGPVPRGDWKTVERHLSALKTEDVPLYQELSLHLLKMAEKKGDKTKKEGYEKLENCLRGWKE